MKQNHVLLFLLVLTSNCNNIVGLISATTSLRIRWFWASKITSSDIVAERIALGWCAIRGLSRKRKAIAVPMDGGDAAPSTPAGATTPKKRRKVTTEQMPEKRMARYISSPSIAVKERIQRAFEHRLYLIEQRAINAGQGSPKGCEFFVLGATGNVYTVKLEREPSCTCPDAARGNTCKHFLFVMLRVLKLPQSDPRVWQKAFLSSELEDLLNISAINEGVLASQTVRQRFLEITGIEADKVEDIKKDSDKGIQRDIDGDCPICYESMAGDGGKAKEPVVFCKACGNSVHRDCFEKWSRSKKRTGGKVTCIYCRANWFDVTTKKGQNTKADPHGYVNLASYCEGHADQDTSLERLYPDSWDWIQSQGRRRR